MKLIECIIVSKEINDKFILAKNRDRPYRPILEIVHSIIDGVEVAYLRDTLTDWSEGMNEYGIGVVNSALSVERDEAERKKVKSNNGKVYADGDKMRNIFKQSTLKEAIKAAITYIGDTKLPLEGHTFVSSPKQMVSVETTSKHGPDVKLKNVKSPIVRTNHGHVFTDAGYTYGEKYLSSKLRKIAAQKMVDVAKDWTDVAGVMRKDFFKKSPFLNMVRSHKKMFTSSQTVMNLTDKILEISYYENRVKDFKGINNQLPKGYTPKIKIQVNKIEND
jgi:hypothetical protein